MFSFLRYHPFFLVLSSYVASSTFGIGTSNNCKKKLTERLTDQLKAEHKFREKKFHSAEELPLSDWQTCQDLNCNSASRTRRCTKESILISDILELNWN